MNRKYLVISVALLLAGIGTSEAATFCVSTGAQLFSALETAENNNQNDVIKITSGVKVYANPVGYPYTWEYTPSNAAEADNSLAISGGWNTGCTTYSIGAQHTVLDGTGIDATVLHIAHDAHFVHPGINATVSVSNLSIVRANGTDALTMFTYDTNPNAQFLIDTVQVLGAYGRVHVTGGRIDVVNFMMSNVDVGNTDAARFWPSRTGSRIAFSTVHGNRMGGTTDYGLSLRGFSRIQNVAAFGNRQSNNNPARDVNILTTALDTMPFIDNNHFQNYMFDTVAWNRNANMTEGAPSMMDITVGLFQSLQPEFGALQNSALTIDPTPARDIFGRARITQWAPDRGAVESNHCVAPSVPAIQDLTISERNTAGNPHAVGTLVGNVVYDSWGTTTSTITSGNVSGIFYLNPDKRLTLANPGQLDYETVRDYFLTLSVTDTCGTSTGTIRVNVTNWAGDDPSPLLFVNSFE